MDPRRSDLQGVLRHAERLAALLFVHELTPPRRNEAACVWLLGRAAEVERYIETVVEDRQSGRIDPRDAAIVLQRYLDSLHAGLATVVGATSPSCCHPSPRRRRRGPPAP